MRALFRFIVWTLIVVAGLIGVARVVAIRWFYLPTDDPVLTASVLPSLSEGDFVVAMRINTPKFGDLVVCPEPNFPSRYVIGRIIGETGDEIVIKNGIPTVSGKKFRFERSCDPRVFNYLNPNDDSDEIAQQCNIEAIANHLHKVGNIGGHQYTPEELQIDVTEGKLFLLSDNRLYPYDSRDFGLVDADSCKETIIARLISKKGWTDAENRLNYIQ